MKQVAMYIKKSVEPLEEAWKNLRRFFIVFLLITMAAVGLQTFTSCDLLGVKEGDTILGTWKSPEGGDGYKIYYNSSQDQYRIEYFNNFGTDFKGIIQKTYTTNFKEKNGYIVLLITDKGNSPYLEIELDKYYVVRWEDFIGDSIRMGNAYKQGGVNIGLSTPQDAKNEYTVENGYFAYMGNAEYQRQ